MKFGLFFIFALVGCANPKFPEAATVGRSDAVGASTSCSAQFSLSGHCVAIRWEREQTERDPGVFVFKLTRPSRLDGSPVLDDMLLRKVDLWMPDMNHGSSPITLEKIDIGTWRASFVWFSMPGRWQIRFFGEGGNDAVLELVR